MFDIKNLDIKDFIIFALVLISLFLAYKYFINYKKITELKNEIDIMKQNLKLVNDTNNDSSDTYSNENYNSNENSEHDDTGNYITNKTIETFNNNKKNNIECEENICFIKKDIIKNDIYNQVNNLANEVDNIIRSDVYIPINLKEIINNVYESEEILTSNILINDNIINITPNQIDNYEIIKVLNNQNTNNQNTNNQNTNNQEIFEDNQNTNQEIFEDNQNNNQEIFEDITEENIIEENIIESDKDIIVKEELNNDELIEIDENIAKENLTEINQNISKDLNVEIKSESNKEVYNLRNMKINDVKNLAKKYNIKITDAGKTKNKDQLINEINKYKNNMTVV